jgi:hypothetical protein
MFPEHFITLKTLNSTDLRSSLGAIIYLSTLLPYKEKKSKRMNELQIYLLIKNI